MGMEFNEKLQQLRKQKGLTQEELAEALFVSRTAISKWESGRGYPNIDSLKAVAGYFSVTIDDLLSGEQLLSIAQQDRRQGEARLLDLVFGLLDCSAVLLLFLPFFGQIAGDGVQAVSLLSLTGAAPWLHGLYGAFVAGMTLVGLLTLALQNCSRPFWVHNKHLLSLAVNGGGTLLLILSRQPYPAALLFLFLTIKGLLLLKRQ